MRLLNSQQIIPTLICLLFSTACLNAQCFEPDASIWENSWASCASSPNPKAAYGNGHWIQYDLGQQRRLSKTWVWNTNDPAELDRGFQLVKIDYSIDGTEWTYWGEMVFPQGSGAAVYGGFPGPDLVGIQAQYILLTAQSNYGDPTCYGLAEVKFNLLPFPDGASPDGNYENCSPVTEVEVEIIDLNEVLISWTPAENVEDYLIEYRLLGTESWSQITTEDIEVYLEGLLPLETYEYRISSLCYSEVSPAVIDTFVLSEEALCPLPEEVEINLAEIGPTEAFLYWEMDDIILDDMTVTYYPAGTPQNQWQTLTVEAPEVFLDDLLPATTYYLLVNWNCGEEPYTSDEFSFVTRNEDDGYCNAISDITIETLDYTTASFSWEPTNNADGYTVAYSLEDEGEWMTIEVSEPNITLIDLLAESAYWLVVGVRCGENLLWSEPHYFETNPVVSAQNFNEHRSVKIFPNPTRGLIAVEYISNQAASLQYELVNALGQVVSRGQWTFLSGQQQYLLDLSSEMDGVYWLRIGTVGGPAVIMRRVVKM